MLWLERSEAGVPAFLRNRVGSAFPEGPCVGAEGAAWMCMWVLTQQGWAGEDGVLLVSRLRAWEEASCRCHLVYAVFFPAASWASLPLGLNVQGKGHSVKSTPRLRQRAGLAAWRAGLAQGVGLP